MLVVAPAFLFGLGGEKASCLRFLSGAFDEAGILTSSTHVWSKGSVVRLGLGMEVQEEVGFGEHGVESIYLDFDLYGSSDSQRPPDQKSWRVWRVMDKCADAMSRFLNSSLSCTSTVPLSDPTTEFSLHQTTSL